MMASKIVYLSYGKFKTGGYRYESFFTDEIQKFIEAKGNETQVIKKRPERLFENPIAHIKLFFWAFFNCNGNINVIVARLALAGIFRNLFNKNKVLIVIHHNDENYSKSGTLKVHFYILFKILQIFRGNRFLIITGAQYWVEFFKVKIKCDKRVFLYPNLFDNKYYERFRVSKKEKRIHLGQYSKKNDPKIFELAARLSSKGYECYFSTNEKSRTMEKGEWSIKYFKEFEDYLKYMAECEYTLGLTYINEGWNRLVHESILIGTQVIGYNKAGLGEQLIMSNSLIAKDIFEVESYINDKKTTKVNPEFFERFNLDKSQIYLTDILEFS